ncbi:ribosome maturation factor RimP [Thermoanaerobacterium thermosaccharolyticum]|uniref:Ribosome maturation factor RimP n=1 Tax=Thermoanaerobacterium thermosaccharolyticum TaxID=1517 RepID=A0A223I2R1_THETR|nr:ribosome maturation factor RimP [Thermoanaerobacterium thermosaccharolyticum]AST59031.1 ribosome maturation protein [Thermoanaerobacterium thermosaccharolyticum]MBE0068057.1 ribosome maturation factor RimP [Thermoanaerobacterium thermosaccharolyticum]MBE0227801.1 ribosome maturation factor RimP [Thermoanaerobacterium thermosaccharolyticum]MCP2240011.1 ribosome maturation factor RimP [Thermoanaerobacterium thermosaccharolyticum]PHO07729.1 ribosome maturation factor RimP [Thermoanaerobacteriu
MSRIEELTRNLVAPAIEKNNFELVDVEYKKEGNNWYLRVYIDKEGGVSLDDCQIISEYLSEKLDEVDPIQNSYILEVSSPGIDRPLKTQRDFDKFKGSLVEISLYQPIDKKKKYEGELVGLINDKVVITDNGKRKEFDINDISLVKPVIKF